MKRCHLLVTALMPISLFGCRATFAFGQPVLTIAGVVGESSKTAGKYVLGDLTRTSVPKGPLHIRPPLSLQRPLETVEVVKARVFQHVRGNRYDYHVLLGPKLCLDTDRRLCSNTAKGWVETRNQAPHQGAPTFHLDKGWAFLWTNPSVAVAATEWVVGATEGSTIVVEIVDDTKERVYFLEGKEATVTCNKRGTISTPVKFDSSDHGKYIDVTYDQNDCKFSAKKDIIGARKAFIDEVKKIATVAGWP